MLTERVVVVIALNWESRSSEGFPQKRRVYLRTPVLYLYYPSNVCVSHLLETDSSPLFISMLISQIGVTGQQLCVWSFRIALFIFKCSTVNLNALTVRFQIKSQDCWEEINKAMRECWPNVFLFYLLYCFIINAPCGQMWNGLFIAFLFLKLACRKVSLFKPQVSNGTGIQMQLSHLFIKTIPYLVSFSQQMLPISRMQWNRRCACLSPLSDWLMQLNWQ